MTSFHSRLAAGVLLLWAVFNGSGTDSVRAADISLDEIRSRVAEQVSSIRSLSVRMMVVEDLRPPIADPPETNTREVTWIRSGEKLLATTPPQPAEGGERAHGGSWAAFDGEWTQIALRDPEHPEKLLRLQRYRGLHRNYLSAPLLENALGSFATEFEGSLSEILALPESRVVGPESIDGADCVKIEVSPHKGRSFDLMTTTVWLDPAQGWLPRKLVSDLHPDSSMFAKAKEAGVSMADELRIVEFRDVADPQQGTPRPFPWKLRRRTAFADAEVEVLQVDLNGAIPDGRFVIAPTIGTEIKEGTSPKDPKARKWAHGGAVVRDKLRKERVEQARQQAESIARQAAEAEAGKPMIDASPRLPGNTLAWSTGFASLLFAALALWLWKQRG